MKSSATIAGCAWGLAVWGVILCMFWTPWGLVLTAIGAGVGLKCAKNKKAKVGP